MQKGFTIAVMWLAAFGSCYFIGTFAVWAFLFALAGTMFISDS